MNATSMFWPSASSPRSVDAPSAITSPRDNLVADLDDRTLVDVRVLVRTRVLDQVVDVDADFTGNRFVVVHANHDTARIDVIDHAAAERLNRRTRVDRHRALDAGTDHGLFRTQARHRLTLHVRAHQRAVRIVVLEERNQRSCDRHDLRRRHVHVLDAVRRHHQRFAASRDDTSSSVSVPSALDARHSPARSRTAFFDRRQIVDLIGDLAVHDLAVRRFEEAVFVQVRAYSASELIRPMFGPSGVSIGHTRP